MDVDVRHRSVAARGRAPVSGAVALGLLAAVLTGSPAGALTVPECVPDGSRFLEVQVVDTVPVGELIGPFVAVRDSCGEFDTGFTGTVELTSSGVDGDPMETFQVTFSAGDRGAKNFPVRVTRPGLTFLDVTGPVPEENYAFTTFYAYDDGRLPLVEGLDVSFDSGTYRAAGTVVDPDAYGSPVAVTVELDSREVLRVAADQFSEDYEFAPQVVGFDTRFETTVPVPPGRHSLCLFVEDRVLGGGPRRLVNVECRVVDNPAPAPTLVFGRFDALARVPSGLVATGWALDASRPGGTARVQMVRTFRPAGSPGAFTSRPLTSIAELNRPDVGAAFPTWGSRHGFVVPVGTVATGDSLEACIRVGAPLVDLGCRSMVLRHDPLGALDAVTPVRSGAILTGWALDEDTYDPLDVHVYVDGALGAVLRADGFRADVGAAFPDAAGGLVEGYGPFRGYSESLAMPGGRHEVCAYGINVDELIGQGRNALLGCRTVVVPSDSPLGRVDAAVPAPGGFVLRGWAADPDQPLTALDVHTYRDGVGVGITPADRSRPDLVGLDGGRYGTAHGYTTGTISTGARSTVCSYAINVGRGSNTTLSCLDLQRALAPTGAFDGLTPTLRESGAITTARGWALDPDTAAAVDVHVYVDGRLAGVTSASTSRPDVGTVFPGWGDGHGWSLDVRAALGQRVCAYAINTAQGSGNTTLGCRTA